MRQTTLRRHLKPALALLTFIGSGVIMTAPGEAQAQHCRLHYAEAFQLITTTPLSGRTPTEIKQTVDDIFGPRQEVCGEAGYKFFLTELGTQASTAFRKKGSEQEVRLLAIREILNRFPLRVRFSDTRDPAAGMVQLRADLGVLSKEVGVTPHVQSLLDALAKISPPKTQSRPLPKDDDALPVTVPRVPLPAWAIISLYEIRDHALQKENGAVVNKTNLILDWVARINAGARPGDLKVAPSAASPSQTAVAPSAR